ncbi:MULTISPECIES: BCCT family transporter [unclassified Paraburkholderia]
MTWRPLAGIFIVLTSRGHTIYQFVVGALLVLTIT